MDSIPIFRTAHIIPHIEFLRKLGTPVDRYLSKAKLPLMIYDRPDAYLPLINALSFLKETCRSENIDSFGLRCIESCKTDQLNQYFVALLFEAPSLYAALQSFLTFAYLENPSIDWRIEPEGDSIKVYSSLSAPCCMAGLQYSEWKQNKAIIDIVRIFAGAKWEPEEMAFRSNLPLGLYASEKFPNTHFLTAQQSAWISFPRSLLSLPAKNKRTAGKSSPTAPSTSTNSIDFSAELKLILQAYLGEGRPDIHLAAEIAGISVRTLQRRLKQYGLNYSTLVQHVQLEYAMELLGDPDLRTLDIAYLVGYEDPSNFSRAFRQIVGISPREYRTQLCSR